MYKLLANRYPWLLAGLTAALLLGLGGGVAFAGSSYSVHVKVVPKTIPLHSHFKIKIKGVSGTKSMLVIFLNRTVSCAATEAVARTQGSETFSGRVKGRYVRTLRHFSKFDGQHHACAYLIAPSDATRAHSGSVYTVG